MKAQVLPWGQSYWIPSLPRSRAVCSPWRGRNQWGHHWGSRALASLMWYTSHQCQQDMGAVLPEGLKIYWVHPWNYNYMGITIRRFYFACYKHKNTFLNYAQKTHIKCSVWHCHFYSKLFLNWHILNVRVICTI